VLDDDHSWPLTSVSADKEALTRRSLCGVTLTRVSSNHRSRVRSNRTAMDVKFPQAWRLCLDQAQGFFHAAEHLAGIG